MADSSQGRVRRDFRYLMSRLCPACARAMSPRDSVSVITPQELCGVLARGESVAVLDLRHPLDTLGDARVIPGAQRIRPQELAWGRLPFAREQAIVAYCALPQETASRHAARLLRKRGFKAVKVLRGGFAAWRDSGLPLAYYQAAEEDRGREQRRACRRKLDLQKSR